MIRAELLTHGGDTDVVFLIGRILFTALFIGSSIAHLTDRGAMGDVSLTGASLILLFLVWELGDATPLTITDPLFDVD